MNIIFKFNFSGDSYLCLFIYFNFSLDTVNEEEEDDLNDTRHEMLGATSNTNSLNMQGNNSQVPLLSGVFRDVFFIRYVN